MWLQYRMWKHALGLPLVLLALLLMKKAPETSLQWYLGLGIALSLTAAYLIEEIVWISNRQGRPCGQCGQKIPMKSFTVVAQCPHCGLPLD
jgi:hypothetical protein